MGELAAGLLQLFFGCAVVAFIMELALNRRPILVAFVVALIATLGLAISASAHVGLSDFGGAIEILLIVIALGFVASLIGSASARGIRIAIRKAGQTTTTDA